MVEMVVAGKADHNQKANPSTKAWSLLPDDCEGMEMPLDLQSSLWKKPHNGARMCSWPKCQVEHPAPTTQGAATHVVTRPKADHGPAQIAHGAHLGIP